MGLDHPDVPGYDPVTQALCGYMDLTGHADGPPLQCGPPLIDLKAGDEAYTQIIHALWERSETGNGKCIDISMAQVAVSWLHTFLPMLDMGNTGEELRRSGNEHRQFIPVNAYRTCDRYVYIAIGSDSQWNRFIRQPIFSVLDQARFAGNEGRRHNKTDLHSAIEAITQEHSSAEVSAALVTAGVPHSPITPIEEVPELPFVRAAALRTTTPDGQTVRLPPPAVSTPHLEQLDRCLPFAPAYSGDSRSVFTELGLSAEEIAKLEDQGIAAVPAGRKSE
jgi:crotonobetainyl-CoA:carnitine CoA-transferase CaiB-like acyl-CoA transferase